MAFNLKLNERNNKQNLKVNNFLSPQNINETKKTQKVSHSPILKKLDDNNNPVKPLLKNMLGRSKSTLEYPQKSDIENDKNIINRIKSYAVKTRKGFIPEKADKINQDRAMLIPNLGNIPNLWLFGVFDGHGINGHHSSQFVLNQFPSNFKSVNITKAILKTTFKAEENPKEPRKLSTIITEKSNIDFKEEDIKKAFHLTNNQMNTLNVDFDFSGTTVVTILLYENKLVCANAGDSRAILAFQKPLNELKHLILPNEFQQMNQNEKVWVALPLSRDHKPDEPDEQERILKANGRIDPFKEPNGDPIGPCRVWLKNEEIPGLAMSRSLGDRVAHSVGVTCEPEIFETVLSKDDKFIVIASDGIWEFLPNDEVVEMIVPFYEANDPDGACEFLIKESVKHWKEEDEIIDDITIIVIFLNDE